MTPGEPSFETNESGTVTATKYAGPYSFDEIEFQVAEDATITIPGETLSVTGFFASWHDGTSPLLAGAVYPGENFVKTVQESLTEAIDVRLDIDLGLSPGSYRENVLDLIGSVK